MKAANRQKTSLFHSNNNQEPSTFYNPPTYEAFNTSDAGAMAPSDDTEFLVRI